MNDDHIKTVVMDTPIDHRAQDNEERDFPEQPDAQEQNDELPAQPLRSWLT